MAAYRYLGHTLDLPNAEPERIVTLEVSPSLFRTLGTEPNLGRAFLDEEETPGSDQVAILSYGSWVGRYGGDPDVIESTIRLDGQLYTVVGIMPRGFEFPPGDAEAEVWLPLQMLTPVQRPRNHRMFNVVARVASGRTLADVVAEMNAIAADIERENPDTHRGWGVTLISAHERLVGNVSAMLWVLFAAVSVVLSIGCVNVANLMLARSAESTRELAIRSAFGARGWAILRLSLIEGLSLALAGGLGGVLLAYVGVIGLKALIPPSIPRADQIQIDTTVLTFTVLVSVAAGIVFGLVPAFRAMRLNLSQILQSSSRTATAGRRTRWMSDGLVGCQIAFAVVLLVGAGLLVGSLVHLIDVDPGFRRTNLVSAVVSLPASRYGGRELQRQFYSDLMSRLADLPGIQSVGAVSALPMSDVGDDLSLPFDPPGLQSSSPSERPRAAARIVMAGYFRAMGIPLVRGRVLDDFDGREGGRQAMVINQTMADVYFKDIDPIGQVLTMPMMGNLEIVGVVGDVRHDGLQAQAGPEVFVPYNVFPRSEMQVVVHSTGAPEAALSAIRDQILEIDPQQPISASYSIEELLSTSIAQPRFNMALLVGFASAAILLAAFGIYAVVSYMVARRTTELGVRMALGADRRSILRMIVGESMRVVVIASTVGIVAAFGLARSIRSLLYEVQPTDPLTFAAAVFVAVSIGMLASAVPALRAMRVDPAVALRND
jgi:putative ABC transport system permease protein